MARLKEFLRSGNHTWQLLFIAVILVSLGFHTFLLADIFKSPPSDGFSRELKIGEVAYGNSKYNRNHMVTALSPDQKSIGIFAVDGSSSKIFQVDATGKILLEKTVALDLSEMAKISAYFIDATHLRVLYGTDALYSTIIDMETGAASKSEPLTIMEEFDHDGSTVMVTHDGGLYGIDLSVSNPQEVLIMQGSIDSFRVTAKEDLLYVTVVNEIDLSFTSGQSLILNKDFEIVAQYEVFPKTDKRLIGRIKDVYFNDGILTSLFVWSDTKGNKNLVTALQSDIDTGAQLTKFSQFFALSFDKMSIDRAEKGQVSLIMQDNLMGGQNIVYNTLKDGASTITVPLSKIRGVSALPSYYEADGKRILIFSDLNKKARDIYIASSDLELIKNTTSYRTINFALVFGTCIFISIVAVFAALIMILVFEPLPGIVLLILYKLTDPYKHKFKVQMWVPAVFHTIVKIYASLKLAETTRAISEVDLSILGSKPFIYALLILSSVFALFCTHRCAKQRNDYDSVINYAIFVLLDLALYACTLLAFVLSSLLIYKL